MKKVLPRTASPPLSPLPPPSLPHPQECAQSKEWEEAPSFPLPSPPDFLPNFQMGECGHGILANDPPLDINTARQALLKRIQQGVNLKPVSSDVGSESDPEFLSYRHFC